MRGFSQQDQQLLSLLIRVHRRKFPKGELEQVPEKRYNRVLHQCILLRLSVLLGHGQEEIPPVLLSGEKNSLELTFPDNWLQEHPLTRENLKIEANYLKAVDFELSYSRDN